MREELGDIILGYNNMSQDGAEKVRDAFSEKGAEFDHVYVRYKKYQVFQSAKDNENVRTVIVMENLESTPYTAAELKKIKSIREGMKVIVSVSNSRKGTDYMKELYENGIYRAVFDEQSGFQYIYSIVCESRSRKATRKYYGLPEPNIFNTSKMDKERICKNVELLEQAENEREMGEILDHMKGMLKPAEIFVVLKHAGNSVLEKVILCSGVSIFFRMADYRKDKEEERKGKKGGIVSRFIKGGRTVLAADYIVSEDEFEERLERMKAMESRNTVEEVSDAYGGRKADEGQESTAAGNVSDNAVHDEMAEEISTEEPVESGGDDEASEQELTDYVVDPREIEDMINKELTDNSKDMMLECVEEDRRNADADKNGDVSVSAAGVETSGEVMSADMEPENIMVVQEEEMNLNAGGVQSDIDGHAAEISCETDKVEDVPESGGNGTVSLDAVETDSVKAGDTADVQNENGVFGNAGIEPITFKRTSGTGQASDIEPGGAEEKENRTDKTISYGTDVRTAEADSRTVEKPDRADVSEYKIGDISVKKYGDILFGEQAKEERRATRKALKEDEKKRKEDMAADKNKDSRTVCVIVCGGTKRCGTTFHSIAVAHALSASGGKIGICEYGNTHKFNDIAEILGKDNGKDNGKDGFYDGNIHFIPAVSLAEIEEIRYGGHYDYLVIDGGIFKNIGSRLFNLADVKFGVLSGTGWHVSDNRKYIAEMKERGYKDTVYLVPDEDMARQLQENDVLLYKWLGSAFKPDLEYIEMIKCRVKR